MILLINNILRASPIIIILMLCFYSFIDNIYWPIYLNIFLIIGDLCNHYLLKNGLFKILYENFGYKNYKGEITLPLLGIYNRPKYARNCGFFENDNYNKKSSKGMSSGHSQMAFTFVIFIIRYIIKNNDDYMLLKNFSLLCLASLIGLSRVYLAKCHTLQQVIIGSIIGFLYGYFVFDILNMYNLIN